MTLREKIEKILNEKPFCKDNDDSLCLEIWGIECLAAGYNISSISALHFLNLESKGFISKKQSILRCRRKLNQKKPSTIGKSYKSNLKKDKREKIIKMTAIHQKNIDDRKHNFNIKADRGQNDFTGRVNIDNKSRDENIEGYDPKLSVLTG